jgi:hypothetical protein
MPATDAGRTAPASSPAAPSPPSRPSRAGSPSPATRPVRALAYVRLWKPVLMLRRPYRVTAVRPERGNAWTLALEPEGHPEICFQPGQFTWLSLWNGPFGMREPSCSFSSSAERQGRWQSRSGSWAISPHHSPSAARPTLGRGPHATPEARQTTMACSSRMRRTSSTVTGWPCTECSANGITSSDSTPSMLAL